MTRDQLTQLRSAETASLSAYLLQPLKPEPQWLGGERVRFPGEFGFSVAKRPTWDEKAGEWIYGWEIDERIAA